MHNHTDKYCIRILKNLIPALKPGVRIVIYDPYMGPPKTMSVARERQKR